MASPRSPSSLPSSARHRKKLWRYVLAVEATSKALQAIETRGLADKADFERLLQEILPNVQEAFNSEGTFYADTRRRIRFAESEDSILVDKRLPVTKSVTELLESDTPLVITEHEDRHPELDALGVKSLLIVTLDTPWGKYLMGVCDGRDELAYDGEDKKFFKTLMEILGLGLSYGHTQAETRLAYERYQHAQRRGEYSFLSRASEDYARFMLHLQSDVTGVRGKHKPNLDDLLADYLDAELCKAMHDSESRSKSVTAVDTSIDRAEVPKPVDHLLSLVRLPRDNHEPKDSQNLENHQCLVIWLHDNKTSTEQLTPRQYPRTALAVARIGLWAGYIKAGARVPDRSGKRKQTFLPEDLRDTEASSLFDLLPRWLLEAAKPSQRTVKSLRAIRWRIDWLRTLWQRIYYLARNGVSEPRPEWGEEINGLYAQIRPLTAWMLHMYLDNHILEEGLQVDSDWLSAWLASNVLLGKSLAEYYRTADATDDNEPISGPVEKMRYLTHLSHQILYSLHCIRHLQREKEVRARLKRKVEVQRLPFTEVPVNPSLSLSDAQLYILSEYAYREIEVPRELVLLERLGRQLRYELPLYAASEFYRDHLYHVFDVCLLGELLLRRKLPPGSTDIASRSVINVFSNSTDNEQLRLFLQNWYIAALCHDLGYVVEQASSFLEPVHTISGPGLDDFHKALRDGLKDGGKKIRKTIKSKLSSSSVSTVTVDDLKNVESTDHGIAAWLHLNHWIDQVQESSESLAHALNAILRHNLPEQKVSLSHEPLTLLLMLCDHLQEWGRPRVGPDPLARRVLEALRFSERLEFDQKIRVRQLIIKGLGIVLTDQNGCEEQVCDECLGTTMCESHCPRVQTEVGHDGLEFELRHVESWEADFEPAVSWLLLCRDLQCFGNQPDEFPFDIKITLKHTPSRIWQTLPWKPLEMDLIQEFASEYEPATYLCEWVEKARRDKDGIHYEGNRDEGSETFTIHLNQLGRPLQRGLSDEHWRQFFKWKWRRLGQQYIDLSLGAWFPDF